MPQYYARVSSGVIVSYPHTAEEVTEINVPTDDYLELLYAPEPPYNHVTQRLVEKTMFLPNVVFINYDVTYKSLEDLFSEVGIAAGSLDGNGNVVIDVSKITPDLFTAVVNGIKVRTQKHLDDFASTRGYDGMGSACSYFNSTNPNYKAEADRCIVLRDTTWTGLYGYLDNVLAGTEQAPTSWTAVFNKLPALTWT